MCIRDRPEPAPGRRTGQPGAGAAHRAPDGLRLARRQWHLGAVGVRSLDDGPDRDAAPACLARAQLAAAAVDILDGRIAQLGQDAALMERAGDLSGALP